VISIYLFREQIKADNLTPELNLVGISSVYHARVGKIVREVLRIQLDELGKAQSLQPMVKGG
jgi:hypothetical protein